MDNLSPAVTICIMSGAALILALLIINGDPAGIKKRLKDSVFVVSLILLIPLGYWMVLSKMMERFHFLSSFADYTTFRYQEHSRQGIITVLPRPKGADVFFGGGAYDGDVNTDPENNVNGISRCYMIGSLHRKPSKVLMIGLSTGSWAQVLANYKLIDSLTIIEIQPGYINLIKKYDEISPLLSNPKVKIIIDDGRRWMRRNQNEKFDFIVMNTTFHWREHSTNLLSVEFLRMAKKHLNEKGVMYWNTTGSKDVMYTAAHAFGYVTSVANFAAASDSPFDMSKAEREKNYPYFFRNSLPAFEKNDSTRIIRNKLINAELPVLRDSLLRQNFWLITEDNMASEYKSGLWSRIIKFKNSF
jgi:spermidine synthase